LYAPVQRETEGTVNKRYCNLNGYLAINLILVGVVLIGLWRNQPVFDSSVRLTSLLVLLVLINAILVIRESLFTEDPAPRGRKKAVGAEGLRRVFHQDGDISPAFMSDALSTVLAQTPYEGMVVLLFEEGGFFSPLGSSGCISPQFAGARFLVGGGELKIKHPGGLGEESVCRWPFALNHRYFQSSVTHLRMEITPLKLFGKCRGLWVALHDARSRKKATPSQLHALFIEATLALSLNRSQSAEGHAIDMQTGLLRFESFQKSFDIEIERSERYQQAMTLVLVAVDKYDEIAPPRQENIRKAVGESLRESLRRLDLSFSWNKPGVFAAVLTETDTKVAKMVGDRIINSFRRHLVNAGLDKDFASAIHVGFATYPSDASHGHGLLEMAEEALHDARERSIAIVSYPDIPKLRPC
jgi:GGDEF domain-containing protein